MPRGNDLTKSAKYNISIITKITKTKWLLRKQNVCELWNWVYTSILSYLGAGYQKNLERQVSSEERSQIICLHSEGHSIS